MKSALFDWNLDEALVANLNSQLFAELRLWPRGRSIFQVEDHRGATRSS
jgi:hypothetical protein